MNGYKVIVNKSTVPVGTAAKVRDVIRRETTHPFSVVSNPEFLKQGAAIDDFMKPDRVVIGAEDPRGAELMKELYAPFTRTGAPIMMMDCASAELCKYAANAMLATRISFMNEVANVCEAVGADVDQVRRRSRRTAASARRSCSRASATAAAASRRTSRRCCSSPARQDYDFQILKAVEAVNERQKTAAARQAEAALRLAEGQAHRGLGPGVQAAHRRHARGAGGAADQGPARRGRGRCSAYDPEAMKVAKGIFGKRDRPTPRSSYDALTGADALALVTEWNEFREPDFARMKKADARRRSSSTAATSTTPIRSARRASPTTRWAGHERGPGHRRRRLHRQPCRQGAGRGRPPRRGLRQPLGRASRGGGARRRRRRRRWSTATSAIRRASGRRCAEHEIEAVMHFAAWLSVGESVRDPAGYYRNNVVGALSVLEAMVAAGVQHFVFSSTARGVRQCRSRRRSPKTIPSRPINAYGETKLAIERALPHYERAYGLPSIALRYFNAAGADPDGELGEDHEPEMHVHSPGDRRGAAAAPPSRSSATTTTRRTAPACATTSTSPTWRRRTCWRSTRCAAARRPTVYNLGNGRPTSVREILESVERVTGRRVPVHGRPAPRRRSGGAVRQQRAHPPRARLGAAVRGRRHHRRNRLALAGAQSPGLCSRGDA